MREEHAGFMSCENIPAQVLMDMTTDTAARADHGLEHANARSGGDYCERAQRRPCGVRKNPVYSHPRV